MYGVPLIKPGNLPRSAANRDAAPASSESRLPEHVPAPDRFVPDTGLPACRTVPPLPGAHGSAASHRRCPPEWSSWLPLRAQSEPAWRSRPIQKLSDVLPASSACIPTALHVVPDQPTWRLRCQRTPQVAYLQDPGLKRLLRYSC